MRLLIILQITTFTLVSCEAVLKDFNYFPHYGNPAPRRSDIPQSSKIEKQNEIPKGDQIEKEEKEKTPNKTVYVNDILHYKIDKKTKWKKQREFETEFRKLIAMTGLKYTYKRDTFWRTWRKVLFSEQDKVICYRCENSANFTYCHNSGYWVIEEKPPCPYELFSMSKENKICAVHIDKYYNASGNCSEINISELTGVCDNPIVTEWQIQIIFRPKVTERALMICGGRESCTISTLYEISTDYISFSIVNSTNDVIYSRIMKQGYNYACTKDCGKMDPNTKTISKVEKSLLKNEIKTRKEQKTIIV